MISNLIDKYKSIRKTRYLDQLSSYRHTYAFIGAGNHSISNLYPCLHQLNVPLRYICTKTIGTATKMAASFPNCTGITDLDTILADPAIKGVFVSTQPKLHPEFIQRLLSAGKAVFVEKPPAFSKQQLEQLIALQNTQPCMVGLQRRFSTIHQLLKKHNFSKATYHYRYLTGHYPEGDPVYELFIHPVDHAIQIFGPARLSTIITSTSGALSSWYIHLEHTGGASGVLQLSTHHSWSAIIETLEINTEKEFLEAAYPFHLTGTERSGSIAGIPLEKLRPGPLVKKIYLDNQGSIPIAANNSLVSQGFYGEIEHFVRHVEEGKSSAACSLGSLLNTYEILDGLHTAGVR